MAIKDYSILTISKNINTLLFKRKHRIIRFDTLCKQSPSVRPALKKPESRWRYCTKLAR